MHPTVLLGSRAFLVHWFKVHGSDRISRPPYPPYPPTEEMPGGGGAFGAGPKRGAASAAHGAGAGDGRGGLQRGGPDRPRGAPRAGCWVARLCSRAPTFEGNANRKTINLGVLKKMTQPCGYL